MTGLCAVFLARATASLAESEFAAKMPARRDAPSRVTAPKNIGQAKDIATILERNIFCADCPPFDPPAPVETAATVSAGGAVAASALDPNMEPERTGMPLALLAVMFAPPPTPPWHSLVVIKDTESLGAGAYGVGDAIREAKVIEISEKRVLFDNKGRLEYLDLLDEPPAPDPTPKVARAGAKEGPTDELGEELDRGLKKTGENTYELQRSTLEQVLGNMSLLSRSARIVPEMRDGKAAGFRLYSVRPTGPFAKIGMQNGDIIHSINGMEMSSPDKAMEIYLKLKSARHLSVGLERNGQKITKEYSIR